MDENKKSSYDDLDNPKVQDSSMMIVKILEKRYDRIMSKINNLNKANSEMQKWNSKNTKKIIENSENSRLSLHRFISASNDMISSEISKESQDIRYSIRALKEKCNIIIATQIFILLLIAILSFMLNDIYKEVKSINSEVEVTTTIDE